MVLVVSRGQVTGPRRLGLLPAEATSFVGRTTELAEISVLLETARMVTVVGPPGVGKTRFALRAAAEAVGQFPDGVRLVDLVATSQWDDPLHPEAHIAWRSGGRYPSMSVTDLEDLDQVAGAVARALGPQADDPAAVLSYLRGKRLLLILDTCEHMVDACAAFADTVLRAAPAVTVLATSRQPLDAPGEHAFPLLPLPVCAWDAAAELFAHRAAAVVPGFSVTPQNQADVARLCKRLDGIPLAIELAAVRLRALPLAELASQLESGIRMLTVSRRGTSPRHQTLRAAVEWSYRLCTPAERTLWERLSVFAGTFDVPGAEDVCADATLPRGQVIHALVGLVDKSVVLRDSADPSRYRLLAALREFGADRLADPEQWLDRLTARSVTMARDFDERFRPGTRPRGMGPGGWTARSDGTVPDQAAVVRGLHQEYENIRAALGCALDPAESATPAARARWRLGADLAVRLSCYWQISGRLQEGRQWLGQVAVLFPEPARERAWALGERGRLAMFQGDLDSALADISESIQLAVAAGRGAELAVARGHLYQNLALTFAGRHEEALAVAETARHQLQACGYRAGLVGLEAQLGYLCQLTGDIDGAVECCDRGFDLLGASGVTGPGRERWLSGYLHLVSGLALVQRAGREHASAVALCRALAAKHELGDAVGTAYAVEALAWLAGRREQYERTVWLLGAADQLWNRTGRRLSGVALMEEFRQRTVKAARRALGERRFAAAYAYGAVLDLAAVVGDAADEVGEIGEAAALRACAVAGFAADCTGDQTSAAAGSTAHALLTRREREIAELVASGLSNREIASRLFISKRTVDAHVEHIFGKLEISSRVQLTVLLQDRAPRAEARARVLN
jgi:predicted ATPase/DNA-binding CsgD family transcriptional regulator/tetratricopeptide (TPR) repeat protein